MVRFWAVGNRQEGGGEDNGEVEEDQDSERVEWSLKFEG